MTLPCAHCGPWYSAATGVASDAQRTNAQRGEQSWWVCVFAASPALARLSCTQFRSHLVGAEVC